MNDGKIPEIFGEAEYIIRADYRRHYEVMRDSSVATSPAQRCPFLSSISFGQTKEMDINRVKGVERPLILLHDPCKKIFIRRSLVLISTLEKTGF